MECGSPGQAAGEILGRGWVLLSLPGLCCPHGRLCPEETGSVLGLCGHRGCPAAVVPVQEHPRGEQRLREAVQDAGTVLPFCPGLLLEHFPSPAEPGAS